MVLITHCFRLIVYAKSDRNSCAKVKYKGFHCGTDKHKRKLCVNLTFFKGKNGIFSFSPDDRWAALLLLLPYPPLLPLLFVTRPRAVTVAYNPGSRIFRIATMQYEKNGKAPPTGGGVSYSASTTKNKRDSKECGSRMFDKVARLVRTPESMIVIYKLFQQIQIKYINYIDTCSEDSQLVISPHPFLLFIIHYTLDVTYPRCYVSNKNRIKKTI